MKIVFFETQENEKDIFLKHLSTYDTSFFSETLTENNVELAKDADVISVFVDSNVDKNLIDKMPNLKFIATRSTGFNHIDCVHAKSKNIQVSNVPAYGSHTVAEFAFGLILNLSRNIISSHNYLREKLDYNYLPWMQGFNLEGKILGVVGTGKIGKNVIKIAQGFEMNVIACDLYPDENFAKENNFLYKSLFEVVKEADIITLHAPYTKENHHLINKDIVSMMKRGVYLINTARGELIDTEALLWGLKEGIITAAGLDVIEGEIDLHKQENKKMISLNHELMKMPNVIVTPHMAFFTKEAITSIQNTTIENIQNFISNSPINLVS